MIRAFVIRKVKFMNKNRLLKRSIALGLATLSTANITTPLLVNASAEEIPVENSLLTSNAVTSERMPSSD